MGRPFRGSVIRWVGPRRPTSGQTLVLAQDAKELDLGGRMLDATMRPYAAENGGIPLKFEFEMATGTFSYLWAVPQPPLSMSPSEEARLTSTLVQTAIVEYMPLLTGHPPHFARESELFAPVQVARGRRIIVEEVRERQSYTYDVMRQTPRAQTQLQMGSEMVYIQPHVLHKVRVGFAPPVHGEHPNDLWTDCAAPVATMSVVLLALFLDRMSYRCCEQSCGDE
jgi:hypothetical protein